MNFSTQSEELTLEDLLTAEEHQLILFNDDVNTFDFVIESLVSICRHDPLQAEQCALIVHYKGKCAVKNGTFDDLEPMCTALLDRGLTAAIEQTV
ncbi:MAG: ATP-dependent Clp protease adaptor ClpS [Flavobacteriales bacterium]